MKETIRNIKKVYQYGKEYKKQLIGIILSSISGIIIGVIVPLLSAKQIVYLTSNTWEQVIYISLVILGVQCYTSFAKYFFWSRNIRPFTKGTTKNLQIAIRKRGFKNRTI